MSPDELDQFVEDLARAAILGRAIAVFVLCLGFGLGLGWLLWS